VPGIHVQLLANPPDAGEHGVDADIEPSRHLLVHRTRRQEFQHLPLPGPQRLDRDLDPAVGKDPGTMVNDAVGWAGLLCVIIAGWPTGSALPASRRRPVASASTSTC
jgi:hypothetical protein